jgi:hypothetical protein
MTIACKQQKLKETAMRYQMIFMSLLALPATAAAHAGAHHGMGMVEWIVHWSGQHGLPGLAGMLLAILLLAGYFGVRRTTRKNPRGDMLPHRKRI